VYILAEIIDRHYALKKKGKQIMNKELEVIGNIHDKENKE